MTWAFKRKEYELEKMPAAAQEQSGGGAVKFIIDLAAGTVAKAVTTVLTFPLHRGVTLLQVEGANPALGAPATPFKGGFFGLFDVIHQTSSSHGLLANYRGATMAIVAPVLVAPVNFAIKDRVKHLFPKYSPKTEFWSFFAANMASGGLAGALTLPIGFLIGWPVKIAQADLRPEGSRLSGFSLRRRIPNLSLHPCPNNGRSHRCSRPADGHPLESRSHRPLLQPAQERWTHNLAHGPGSPAVVCRHRLVPWAVLWNL